jgi:selenocysteine-specific elongation factor
MPVVATAGHVDHGKSTLVQALTGRDPDRWEEEKRRGMTIDLGFAWFDLPSGERVSFVDVPGHRRYMGNMLTGVGPVDAVLLVVAADEGWMPQSEEHLAVLDLLEVDRGVVALTKSDRVDPDLLSRRAREVGDRLTGTRLEGSTVVPVSAPTGYGLDRLISALAGLRPRPSGEGDHPRLWVDRAFTVAGAGTVVTGTLTGGWLEVGQEVALFPGSAATRIRGLQSNEATVDRIGPSHRVAVNLAGVERVGVRRGSMLSKPGAFAHTSRMLVSLRPARYEEGLRERGAFLFHLGTFSSAARVSLLAAGRPTLALVDIGEEVCAEAGDRFVIRDSGRQMVVAGGAVLHPRPPRQRQQALAAGRDLLAALPGGADAVASVMLDHGRRVRLDRLAAWSGGGEPSGALIANGEALSGAETKALAAAAREAVASFHASNRLEEGIALSRLAATLGIGSDLTRALLGTVPDLKISGSTVSVSEAGRDDIDRDPRWVAARAQLSEAGLTPPSIRELGLEGELLRVLVRTGRLVRVSDDLVYLPGEVDRLVELLRSLEGPFTVSDFRQRVAITRKHAVPLLEWSDRQGYTVRRGDLRFART